MSEKYKVIRINIFWFKYFSAIFSYIAINIISLRLTDNITYTTYYLWGVIIPSICMLTSVFIGFKNKKDKRFISTSYIFISLFFLCIGFINLWLITAVWASV